MSRPMPRFTRWYVYHVASREPGDRAVCWTCAAIVFLYAIGVIR